MLDSPDRVDHLDRATKKLDMMDLFDSLIDSEN